MRNAAGRRDGHTDGGRGPGHARGTPRGPRDGDTYTPAERAGKLTFMCGRFTQRFSWPEVRRFLDLGGPAAELTPRYNVAPGQAVAAVRPRDGENRLCALHWGLIPSWSRLPPARRPINARVETAADKPMFRGAFRARRCLIPADGFYEWARRDGAKQPHLIGRADGGLMAFAGLWERWRVPEAGVLPRFLAGAAPGDAVETCAILTAAATAAVAPVHHRMPLIVPPASFGPWLDGRAVPLEPPPDIELTLRPVGTRVNNPAHDDPRCIEPLSPIGA